VPLYLSFPPAHVGDTVAVSVMIHWTPHESLAVPLSMWQSVRVLCVRTPVLAAPPTRLVTSVTWARIGEDLFVDDGSDFWLKTYRGLGFNTVPLVSVSNSFAKWTKDNTTVTPLPTAPSYIFPSGRTGAEWHDLHFGPQISSPNPSAGPSACRKPPNASLLPSGLSGAEIKAELTKWANAFEFSNATGHLDVAYDGIFSKRSALEFCEMMKAMQPSWVFLDDEAFGEGAIAAFPLTCLPMRHERNHIDIQITSTIATLISFCHVLQTCMLQTHASLCANTLVVACTSTRLGHVEVRGGKISQRACTHVAWREA
jgi:hypothetical protein